LSELNKPRGRPGKADRRVTVNVSEDVYVWLGHVARMCGESRSWAANAAIEACREPTSDAEIHQLINRYTTEREDQDGTR